MDFLAKTGSQVSVIISAAVATSLIGGSCTKRVSLKETDLHPKK
jgi:hypothetical protein